MEKIFEKPDALIAIFHFFMQLWEKFDGWFRVRRKFEGSLKEGCALGIRKLVLASFLPVVFSCFQWIFKGSSLGALWYLGLSKGLKYFELFILGTKILNCFQRYLEIFKTFILGIYFLFKNSRIFFWFCLLIFYI